MAKGISVTRTLPARRELVFSAWTRPELMARWFFPDPSWTATVTAELRVGGRYEISMRDGAGGVHLQFGEYREIVPVSRLVFTWSCPELGVKDSVVTVELGERGNHTELPLLHELPPDPKIRREHEEGWTGCLGNLGSLLADERNGERVMNSIKQAVRIEAPIGRVFEALSREAGYRGWWNKRAEVP